MDDMLAEMQRELLILATPVYVDGMTGPLKTMLDRVIPLAEPWVELRDGHCRHPSRNSSPGTAKMALLSVSGFYELDNFDPLVCHAKAIAKNLGRQYAGSLLRPYASALPALRRNGQDVDDIYLALRQAGECLAQEGLIPRDIENRVSRHLVTRDKYIEGLNQQFREQYRAHVTEHEATRPKR
jgi:multimeric flavodoxin WrbA